MHFSTLTNALFRAKTSVSSEFVIYGGRLLFLLCCFTCTVAQAHESSSAFNPRPSRLEKGIAAGETKLVPNKITVAQLGNYALSFTVGNGGMGMGGGLLIAFPKAWFSNPAPLIKPIQQIDSSAPHYVAVTSSRNEAKLNLTIDHQSLDGSIERYRHTMKVTIAQSSLKEGDEITLAFNNTTAPTISGRDEIQLAVDVNGSGKYHLTNKGASYDIQPGPATSALLIAPSQVAIGKQAKIRISLLDKFHNLAENDSLQLELTGLEKKSKRIDIKGRASLDWSPKKAGYYWPELSGPLHTRGGPIRVSTGTSERKIFWGDIHSHSSISKDGLGNNNYAYARDVTGLDFYASAEHGGDDSHIAGLPPGDGISKSEWERNLELVSSYYSPGQFVTLLAYECSFPDGHHNVYFRGLKGIPWPAYKVHSIENLWPMLEQGKAITIPHHLGILWGKEKPPLTGPGLQTVVTSQSTLPGPTLDWSRPHEPILRPALEIYSGIGQSEFFDPQNPLAYEQVKFISGQSAGGPHYAQDAWRKGLRMGVVAASDDHESHPGLSHYGLTAVFASELTRETVFDALQTRQSYGTTGERIILDFKLAGHSMGQEGQVGHSDPVKGHVTVAAPGPIRYAEVMAFTHGKNKWESLIRWETPGRLLETEFEVDIEGNSVLYLRTELVHKTGGRVARAWSSPVWLQH